MPTLVYSIDARCEW